MPARLKTDNAPDVLWGVLAIAAFVKRPPYSTRRLLALNKLPATKVSGRWVSSEAELRKTLAAPRSTTV